MVTGHTSPLSNAKSKNQGQIVRQQLSFISFLIAQWEIINFLSLPIIKQPRAVPFLGHCSLIGWALSRAYFEENSPTNGNVIHYNYYCNILTVLFIFANGNCGVRYSMVRGNCVICIEPWVMGSDIIKVHLFGVYWFDILSESGER